METSADEPVLHGSKLGQYLSAHVPRAKALLCLTDCETLKGSDITALDPQFSERLAGLELGYTDPRGLEALRTQISSLYRTIKPEQVRVENGAGEALLNLMLGILRPGDEVIVHTPSFPPLYLTPRLLGCEVIPWEANPDKSWALDLNFLASRLNRKTKAVVVNFPHNPTGYVPTIKEFETLVKMVAANGTTLISDEIYRYLDHTAIALPAACDVDDRAVSVGSFSKSFGLPGIRLGWCATRNEKLLNSQFVTKAFNTTCNNNVGQLIGLVALENRERILSRNRKTIQANLTLFSEFLASHSDQIRCVLPAAGPVAFAELVRENAAEFCARLFAETGALLAPSTVLDFGNRHIRVGLGRSSFNEGLHTLANFLRA